MIEPIMTVCPACNASAGEQCTQPTANTRREVKRLHLSRIEAAHIHSRAAEERERQEAAIADMSEEFQHDSEVDDVHQALMDTLEGLGLTLPADAREAIHNALTQASRPF